MEIEINSHQQTINITNKRYKNEGANWKKWETDKTQSLNGGFQEQPNLSFQSIDNSIDKLTKIINKTAEKSLSITESSSYAKSWCNKQLTEAYKNYRYIRKMFTYKPTE